MTALWLCLISLNAHAELPDYLREALAIFNPAMPADWACTITTARNSDLMVERFDPSLPPDEQWTLVLTNGRMPSPKEKDKYRQSRPPGSKVGPQTNFTASDIEPGSLTLLHEDDERAEYQGSFRETSSGADKMLGHLILRLVVNKSQPHIEQYTLTLTTPYSPVLGVKMNELQVETTFSIPAKDHPSLPVRYTSRFSGRILLIPTAEILQVSYGDCTKIP